MHAFNVLMMKVVPVLGIRTSSGTVLSLIRLNSAAVLEVAAFGRAAAFGGERVLAMAVVMLANPSSLAKTLTEIIIGTAKMRRTD